MSSLCDGLCRIMAMVVVLSLIVVVIVSCVAVFVFRMAVACGLYVFVLCRVCITLGMLAPRLCRLLDLTIMAPVVLMSVITAEVLLSTGRIVAPSGTASERLV